MYNVTLRRVRANIVLVAKQCVLHILCVCSLRNPAWNAHALRCHIWPVWLYNIFPPYLIKSHDFRKSVTEHQICVLIFSTAFSENFLVVRRIERDLVKDVYWSHLNYPLFLSDFNETWLFPTDFRKILKCHFSWKRALRFMIGTAWSWY